MTTIAQIIPALDQGGAERTTLEMVEAIVRRGWRALVITSGGRMINQLEARGGEVVIMPVHSKNPWIMAMNARGLIRLVRDQSVSLLHARSRAPAWSVFYASHKLGVPLVTTYHGAYQSGNALKRRYNAVMARGDRVIANSHFTADRIRQGFGDLIPDLDERLRVIPRGVDLAYFCLTSVDRERKRAVALKMGIPIEETDDAGGVIDAMRAPQTTSDGHLASAGQSATARRVCRIVLPARLSGWKGHETAIRALGRLRNDGIIGDHEIAAGQGGPLRLIFVGGIGGGIGELSGASGDKAAHGAAFGSTDGNGRDASFVRDLHELARVNGVEDLIHFSGHVDDMPAAYALADIVIVPSTRPEAFGRVAIEAASMERPVIAADHGGVRETVLDGQSGRLVPPGDAAALAGALVEMLSMSRDDRAAMGKCGRAHVEARYSVGSMTGATLSVYDELLVACGGTAGDDSALPGPAMRFGA